MARSFRTFSDKRARASYPFRMTSPRRFSLLETLPWPASVLCTIPGGVAPPAQARDRAERSRRTSTCRSRSCRWRSAMTAVYRAGWPSRTADESSPPVGRHARLQPVSERTPADHQTRPLECGVFPFADSSQVVLRQVLTGPAAAIVRRLAHFRRANRSTGLKSPWAAIARSVAAEAPYRESIVRDDQPASRMRSPFCPPPARNWWANE